MVLLVLVALMVAIGVLAIVWGSDSRETLRSHEHELADHGMTW